MTIEVNGLSKKFGSQEVVCNMSFTLKRGQVLGFLGPNGAGKSTTMKMLTGNLAPSEGNIKVCGIDMVKSPKDAKALIGYLPEIRPLYKEFTVDEYLKIVASLHRVKSTGINKAVEYAKERCGLEAMGKRLIEHLSNGYQQRVGIAQAIVHQPMVVILDEPTVGLDPIQIRDIRRLIREVGNDHSLIISTHILPEVEMVCDDVQIIDKGKLVFNGAIEVLKKQRIGNELQIGLRQPPTVEALLEIDGVMEAEHLPNNMIRIRYAEKAKPAETIVKTAVSKGWGLFQISSIQTSLEEVFVQLTHQDGLLASS